MPCILAYGNFQVRIYAGSNALLNSREGGPLFSPKPAKYLRRSLNYISGQGGQST